MNDKAVQIGIFLIGAAMLLTTLVVGVCTVLIYFLGVVIEMIKLAQ